MNKLILTHKWHRVRNKNKNFLQSQPWMSLQGLFRSVPVIVEKFFTGFNGVLGHQDEAGNILDHDDFGDAVGADARVVHQPAEPATLAGGVNTILLSLMFEIIHVAALRGVHGVACLEIFRSSDINEIPGILYHEVSLVEIFHSLDAPAFIFNHRHLNSVVGVVGGGEERVDGLQLRLNDLRLRFPLAPTYREILGDFMTRVGRLL